MYTKYVCEECGKTYNTEAEAMDCEREHAEFKKAAEAAEAERKGKLEEIKAIETLLKGKIEAYEETYGIRYVPESAYTPTLSKHIDDLIEELLGVNYGKTNHF